MISETSNKPTAKAIYNSICTDRLYSTKTLFISIAVGPDMLYLVSMPGELK